MCTFSWNRDDLKNSLLDSNHVGEKCIFSLYHMWEHIYMYYALQSGNDPLKGDLTFAYLYLLNIGLKTELFAWFSNLANIMLCQAQKGGVDRKFHLTHHTTSCFELWSNFFNSEGCFRICRHKDTKNCLQMLMKII